MTPQQFSECLRVLGWTQRGVAKRVGRSEQNIRQMASGAVRIPSDIAGWLEALAGFHARNPAPVRKAA